MLARHLFGAFAWASVLLMGAAPADHTPASNRAMEARLRTIAANTDWKSDPNKPAERAAYFSSLLQHTQLTLEQRRLVLGELASEQLKAGDPRAALKSLDALAGSSPHLSGPEEVHLHEQRAISWLRLGEQENCLAMHGTHSCVFPLKGGGVHVLPEGAQGAVQEFTWLLNRNKSDALSRWLLNVAYMQLGRYPKDVPPAWLLPESLFRSEADLGEFIDYASLAGVDSTGHAGGALAEDFDGDGLLDLMTSSSGPLDPMHLFHNNGDGTFRDIAAEAGVAGELGGLNLVVTDYDNDGHPDALVLRGGWWGVNGNYPLSLLHNRGDGSFEDVTERAGLLRNAPTQTAAWADFDNDGLLDLFVGYESTPGNPQPSVLYRNNGDGTFSKVSMGIASPDAYIKGVAWGDYDGDGRPDLYLSLREGRNMLLHNDGPANAQHPDGTHWRFSDRAATAGVQPAGNTFATWFFDYDNDGRPDLFVAGYYTDSMQDVGKFQAAQPARAGQPHLYHNTGNGTFRDVSDSLHLDRAILTMGANFGDLDNDGWLDLYLGNGDPSYQALLPNRAFRNDGGRQFQDLTTSSGLGNLQKGHAVLFADLENRGQEDIFEEMGGAFVGDTYQSSLYRNPGHSGHSITLKLVGTKSNRPGYGARIRVTVQDGKKDRTIYRFVGSVSSFGGNPMEQHIGVGTATTVREVQIQWPSSAAPQILRDLPADTAYAVTEGAAAPVVLHRARFTLGQHMAPAHQHGASR